MSFSSTPEKAAVGKRVARRSPSASEIARNLGNFEVWSTYQCCEQVACSDIPESFKGDVNEVFNLIGRLPAAWANKKSKQYRALSPVAPKDLLKFICDAFDACPDLFSETFDSAESSKLFTEITVVFSAWKRLQRMRKSRDKWSEADFAANVYNVFRSPAVQESTHRVHPVISLPQPPLRGNLSETAIRILNTKTCSPDCATFVPAESVRHLAESADAPYSTLKANAFAKKIGSPSRGSSLRYQTTPCAQIPDAPAFEFISSFWEDKKPVHNLLEDAYRQNRMATASATRHLHSLCIDAPVFGLIWASGIVRSHVDWCNSDKTGRPAVYSAPYSVRPGESQHEWHLHRPSDILQVYFLIRNIDAWTIGKFRDRITTGIHHLARSVTNGEHNYEPWKRVGDLKSALFSGQQKENVSQSVSMAPLSSPEPRGKGKEKARKRR